MIQKKTNSLLAGLIIISSAILCESISFAERKIEYKTTRAEAESRLLSDIKYLADDERQGRGIGTDGLNQAAEYIRDEFAKAGLDVTQAKGSAFQSFTMVTGRELGKDNSLEFIGPDGQVIKLELEKDANTCSFGGSGEFNAELVFAGYAIKSETPAYNDFEQVDVKGKVVLIIRRVPGQGRSPQPFTNPHGELSQHATLQSKINNAMKAGTAAVLIVNDPFTVSKSFSDASAAVSKAKDRVVAAAEVFEKADPKAEADYQQARKQLTQRIKQLEDQRQTEKEGDFDKLIPFGNAGYGKGGAPPVFHVKQSTCNKLLKAALDKSILDLEAEIEQDLMPHSVALTGWKARGKTAIKTIRSEVKNVIGVLEGKGPLADETIVIGAHYDHVGLGGPGSLAPGIKEVHNGADDNGSGTVSLLELARQLGSRKQKMPRRLVFIAFTAEERGLIGSARYVKEPVFPLDKTIAMFNMDMVGRMRDNKLIVFGNGTSPRWNPILEKLEKKYELEFTRKPQGTGPSDQTSFYLKKIPVLHFFTGTHGDYHRPTDDWQKINIAGMAQVVDLLEEIVVDTAMQKDRPVYKATRGNARMPRSGSRPYFGSIPEFGSEESGYAIQGVAPDSPAAKGGLKSGDVIIKLGKADIKDLNDFDLSLRKFKAGDEVEVTVKRDKKEVTLKVILGKPC